MSVAARYINREVAAIFVVTLLMLLLVAVGGRFIGYLQEAAMGKFTGATVLTIMYLRLPEFIQIVAPFALYTAIVLTMGRLYADQEMVVLQGAGAGTKKLLSWLSLPVGVVILGVAILALYATPMTLRELASFMTEQRSQSEFETVSPGTFHIYDRGRRVTYSEAMSQDRRELQQVFMAQRLEDGRQALIWADSGTQEVDLASGAHYLVLQDGRRYEGLPGTPGFRTIEFQELRQRLNISTVSRGPSVEALPLGELGSTAAEQAEWHWRFALPLFCLIGGMLGLGVSRVKPRQGRFARVVPSVLMMLIYYLLLLINRDALAEGQVTPTIGLWGVHAVFLAIAVSYLRRLGRPVAA
ncbi:MAG: LPS export ABC transporter permease LptF [Pseudomonadales bacterium]|nr:LPS export ABC transporter permease LptF [Pseudomonadales bacterium]